MEYKLLHYTDLEEQNKYVKENVKRILEIMLLCFPSNIELFNNEKEIKKEKEYEEIFNNIIIKSSTWAIWFFCIDNLTNKIIGTCFLYEQRLSYYLGNDEIETYKIIKPRGKSFDIYENRTYKDFYPVINGLCKDPKYKNVGKFMIDELGKYFKSKTSFDKLYLVCESPLFKFNYFDFADINKCVYNESKYNESNTRLIKYYKSNGFKILNKVFYLERCIPVTGPFEPDLYSDIICFNVMCKKF